MMKTYHATVYEPVYYSSREGSAVEANERISATALMHALGYEYGELEKRYMLHGDEATNPDYTHLQSLSFFSTDMEPINATVDEYTFRTVNYPEHSIVVDGNKVSNGTKTKKLFGTSSGFPRRKGNSMSAWNAMRDYVGVSPNSTYEFTVWDEDDVLPDELRFRVGIGRTGMIRAERTDDATEVTLNRYLLDKVLELSDEEVSKLVMDADSYIRDNDPRLHHIVGVTVETADELVED
jgi:CRISPR-associated protein Csc1